LSLPPCHFPGPRNVPPSRLISGERVWLEQLSPVQKQEQTKVAKSPASTNSCERSLYFQSNSVGPITFVSNMTHTTNIVCRAPWTLPPFSTTSGGHRSKCPGRQADDYLDSMHTMAQSNKVDRRCSPNWQVICSHFEQNPCRIIHSRNRSLLHLIILS